MKKNTSFSLLLIFLFSFVYWIFDVTQNNNQKPQPPLTTNNLPLTTIISGNARVIDGDTIEINKNRIRLVGIDAPESKQKCLDKNSFEYFCGEVSTAFLQKLVYNKNVECIYEEKDIYNRYLGDCGFDGVNINHKMIESGMAIIYNLKDTSEELKELEIEAKNKKLGIWQGAFLEPKEFRKKNRHKK